MFKHTAVAPQSSLENETTFYFVENRLLVQTRGDRVVLPDLSLPRAPSAETIEVSGIGPAEVARTLFLGTLDGRPCRIVELRPIGLDGKDDASGVPGAPDDEEGLQLLGLRSLMGSMEEELLRVAGVASQVLDWDRNHQYCGRCGTPTVPSETERSRTCPSCSLTAYPRISPAIIVAVTKGDRILLGHNRRHRASKTYSVLAGFVEPGESLEECVRREVMEEVQVELDDIRYFASQPWPFPDSLMVAFTARYLRGEINVDGEEIVEAGWFDKDHLPPIPPHGTVARRLIDWFVENQNDGESRG